MNGFKAYKIIVTRVLYQTEEYEVVASTAYEAKTIALDRASTSDDFITVNADQFIQDCEEK